MVIIIGAGISGLAAGYYLHKAGVPYTILESSDKAGGYIGTVRDGAYLFELGPNSILADAEMMDFLTEIGLSEDVVEHAPVSQNRFIFRNGRYRKLPSGPLSLLTNTFFSWQTKWAVLRELRHKPAPISEDETVASFFERHFNREMVDYAVAPFVTGIYAGDPHELLLEKVFPKMAEIQAEHGSVLKGFAKSAKSRRKSVNFKNGMAQVVEKLAEGLHIQYQTPATSLRQIDQQWVVDTTKGQIQADAVIISTNTQVAAKLTQDAQPALSRALQDINYVPMTAVHTVFKRSDVGHSLDGFGGLNPKVEGCFAAGSIWASSVFEGKCPKDEVMITSFIGGRGREESTRLPDEELTAKLLLELGKNYQIKGKPTKVLIKKWETAIVQYDKRINPVYGLLPKIEEASLYVCANWYQGVSIPDCIRKGKALAEKLTQS